MSGPTHPTAGELEALRARTLAELEHQLEHARIDLVEFEERSQRAAAAASALELRPLVADLLAETPRVQGDLTVDVRSTMPAAPPEASLQLSPTRPSSEPDHDFAVAIMSGSNRSGRWDPPENVTALCVMGGIRLDFREAAFLEGVVTKVSIFCVMGGCVVIVPPDIHVSVSGTGLLGGFGHVSQTAAHPDAPRLHISGLALMGGVEIKVRDVADADNHEDDSDDN